jgi:hypothetical protein
VSAQSNTKSEQCQLGTLSVEAATAHPRAAVPAGAQDFIQRAREGSNYRSIGAILLIVIDCRPAE